MKTEKPASALLWREGTPVSAQFDDVYFSVDDGLAEVGHVFLAQNDLPERWQCWSGDCSVYETGFGTGLNFLAAWQLWQATSQANNKLGQLHFTSCEKYPLTAPEIEQALKVWPELAPLSRQLTGVWAGGVQPGFNTWQLAGAVLTVFVGEVEEMLFQLDAPCHAWFLDGFAPAKNPAMWTPAVFDEMARLSRPATTFATFTAAGVVKRGLTEAGFTVEKTRGYGRKRDMLKGCF